MFFPFLRFVRTSQMMDQKLWSMFDSPVICMRPEAFRPRLATGLAFHHRVLPIHYDSTAKIKGALKIINYYDNKCYVPEVQFKEGRLFLG